MDYPTLDEIRLQLKSMVSGFFDGLDQAYKQGTDLPEQSSLFLQTFPHFRLDIRSSDFMPREAATSKWLHDSWARILGDLNPNKWQKTTKGQYPKSSATDLVRCVVAHMRWLGKPNTATKQRWTGAELARYLQTPQLILNEYTQITGIKTEAWAAANSNADLERLFSTSSSKSIFLDPGPWNAKIREGEELVFGIPHRAREIFTWVRQQPRIVPNRATRIVRTRPSSQLAAAQSIANEAFQQLLPPQDYSLLGKTLSLTMRTIYLDLKPWRMVTSSIRS
ncbi:MAG: hypothetical protein HC853_05625 [Anaerolineae bacterium]|nr:hypothetical protein [Anaerolineae bacterium]